MIDLYKSPVLFIEENHSYLYEDKDLSGITGMLARQLFPDKYDESIPQQVLKAAAERGSAVHALCEFEDAVGFHAAHDNKSYEQAAHTYTLLRQQQHCKPIANEYTVSDLRHYASMIDCVWATDDDAEEIVLADIKTTYELDEEWLSWQLSIYATLFESQNFGLSVNKLLGVWLPFRGGEFAASLAKVVDVRRIPDEEILRLLDDDANGRKFVPSPEYAPKQRATVAAKASVPAIIADDMLQQYLDAVRRMDESKEVKEKIEEAMRLAMEKYGLKTWDAQVVRATYVPPSESTGFDTAAFRADHPELYDKYCTKKNSRKASLRITRREQI